MLNKTPPEHYEKLYYIQAPGYSGDCLIWWRISRCGYTTNLDEALKLPKDEVDRICSDPDRGDVAYPVEFIDALAHRHLNSEVLRKYKREG